MLISFSLENYMSFQGKAILSLKAGTIKEYQSDNTFAPQPLGDERLLKSVGILGANGSGKSNILKALTFMKGFVLDSSKESNANSPIPAQPFLLSTISNKMACTFEISFYISQGKFRYGFSVDENRIYSEWLFQTIKSKEEKVFIRAEQNYSIGKDFKIRIKDKLQLFIEFTRPNALFVSVLSQFNDELFKSISAWFDGIFIAPDLSHLSLVDYTGQLMEKDYYRQLINNIIRNSDLGIEYVQGIKNEPKNPDLAFRELIKNLNYESEGSFKILTKHNVYDDAKRLREATQFNLIQNESLGTQKFFALLGPILVALNEKKILVVDEIDARLHSLLIERIISMFNSNKYNPNGAQLIFTSHNVNLIKKGLRRDQMVFTEKDQYGSCSISSLYKKDPKIRSDASFDKDYLLGKYGSIPKFPTQLNLFDDEI